VIVIDVGCARHGGDYSIERLIEHFQPTILYGFDPAADFKHGIWEENGCTVSVERAAAWTWDGTVGFTTAGLLGKVDKGGLPTKCIDLARYIHELPAGEEIVLKIDAEGGEYPLLEHLIATGTDARLKLAWVEWHPKGGRCNSLPDPSRLKIEKAIACEVVQWNW
jgi:hypothetical protein